MVIWGMHTSHVSAREPRTEQLRKTRGPAGRGPLGPSSWHCPALQGCRREDAETDNGARAEQEADLETAEDYRQRTVWSKLVGWPQLEGLLLRRDASWCSDDAGLAVAGAYLVLYLLYMSWLDSLAWAS